MDFCTTSFLKEISRARTLRVHARCRDPCARVTLRSAARSTTRSCSTTGKF
jgi:hypothetical protein